jgi:hypothetical protein
MHMNGFIDHKDCTPNLNTATIAGKVITVEPWQGRVAVLMFTVGYLKTWPASGDREEIKLRCYLTGKERIDHASGLQPGEVVLVHGEVTDKGAIYAHELERLSRSAYQSDEDDQFLAGMLRHQQE